MPTVFLIRHGQATAAWNEDRDPGLDATGQAQAEQLAASLHAQLPAAVQLVTSPLRRAQETMAPLARQLGGEPMVESAVAEVPSPGLSLEQRGPWLQRLLRSRWVEVDGVVRQWQAQAVETVAAYQGNVVVVTHAVLINAVVAACTGEEDVLVFRPDYCSVTVLEASESGMKVHSMGSDARTRIL
ncbi:histidine phosphatase family protein [Aquisalimonas sp. 2447]|uniref:histidine phosphatase family protein n=1 Tax=Aquisalimonas sp. 2447 TaxID=2740807 RepID=UPI001432643D|nr:histidine phosphatase family protein [Aquisalimonas sp. 2447]QIT55305.1 histidine phosphatase family protein [Aquisalimonas sp. 2447]